MAGTKIKLTKKIPFIEYKRHFAPAELDKLLIELVEFNNLLIGLINDRINVVDPKTLEHNKKIVKPRKYAAR